MKSTALHNLVNATSATLYRKGSAECVMAVSTDTRSIPAGSVFFALRGENFDAHDFLGKAVEAGAAAVVVDRVAEGVEFGECSVLLVPNVLDALQQFAAWYRDSLDIQVIGITGSNGKTSTKDFVRDVLSVKYQVSATKGNLNNHIGLPLSVLSTEEGAQVCVWEMGMNHPGEISPLCEIAKPDFGVITNIGTAHIEFMGSRDAIASEKGELARSIGEGGALFLPADCDYQEAIAEWTKGELVLVDGSNSPVRAENLVVSAGLTCFDLCISTQGRAKVELPVMGRHMVTNALLAAGVGHKLGLTVGEIAQGLSKSELTSGRLRAFDHEGIYVLDDTYNANLESVSAAIETLAEVQSTGVKYAVLGRIAELGDYTESAYQTIGNLAANRGLQLISVGVGAEEMTNAANAEGGNARHFDELEPAAEWLKEQCASGDTVLFKGSRTAGMERVMNQIFPNK